MTPEEKQATHERAKEIMARFTESRDYLWFSIESAIVGALQDAIEAEREVLELIRDGLYDKTSIDMHRIISDAIAGKNIRGEFYCSVCEQRWGSCTCDEPTNTSEKK